MKNPTLTEIRKAVEASGGEYKKIFNFLSGDNMYVIDGTFYTRNEMIASYKLGLLL